MGIGGISIWQLLIVLAICILLFGTKRIRSLGEDLGASFKGFREGLKEVNELAPELRDFNDELKDAGKNKL